ncbi:MAG: xanthine dehydrogenase family protein subunit M [Pseudaminobacter sp.]|nr:xanthine dehydrogenase family protein subunit M [Pseudaminobacter sp.]
MIRYAKPTSLDDALGLLGETQWRILAGGTDFYPALGARPLRENVLDINGLAELRGIARTASHIVIGARTTWTDIIGADLPPAFDALKQAAREVGSVQIQNTASVAGNLCNASPAADGAPPLLILDAEVELRSLAGTRHLPLGDFILGNRRTALRKNELLTAVRIPKNSIGGSSSFQKLGARRYLVISIAMAAARVEVEGGVVVDAAVAVGSCSAVAMRLTALEAALQGVVVGPALRRVVAGGQLTELTPIDDVRGSAEYRLEAAREIVARAVLAASDHSVTETVAA